MNGITLAKSKVVFNEDEHNYSIDGKFLSGITSIISKYICPNKYDNIPAYILERAKEHGSLVHKQLQMEYAAFPVSEPEPEITAWRKLVEYYGIVPVETEYLVSDENAIASSIDLVARRDATLPNCVDLIDYKTTSKLDKEYLAWQLSIYAYLFERQNPDLRVDCLYAAHLRKDKGELFTIDRIADEHVESLLTAYVNHVDTEDWQNPVSFEVPEYEVTDEDVELLTMMEAEQTEIDKLRALLKPHEEKMDDLKARCMFRLREAQSFGFNHGSFKLSRTKDAEYLSVDTAKLKKEFPDVYVKVCTKKTKRAGSIKFEVMDENAANK